MIVMASTIRPPAPRPWMARKVISSFMFWESPDRIEPIRNTTIANWKMCLRP